jgi:hypothetical protein
MRSEANRFSRSHGHRVMRRCKNRPCAHALRNHSVQWGHRLHVAIDGYANGIVRLIGESYGQHTVQVAWQEFNIDQGRQPFCGYDANAELFYSWLFHRWAPIRSHGHELRDQALYGVPPTRAYLDRRSTSLNPLLRMYLEACLATSPRFYEVLDCEAGTGFRAGDIFTDETCIVSETLASASLRKGDILYAHLIPIGKITLMDAISPQSFPPQSKPRLLRLCEEHPTEENDGPELRRLYFTLSASA